MANDEGPRLETVAEASGYRRTSTHREVQDFLERLRARTAGLRVLSMGRSGLGQDMPVVVVSGREAFTPQAAKDARLPVVLVIANIHAGEVEGKEACLMLARDVTTGPLARLAQRATILLVPDYNPDGNDRIDPKNRALDLANLEGQVGPEGGVGTRYTGAGWNLNRDYTKQDAVETRHLAALMREWAPHVVADCHTTDGSIHGYELTYDTSRNLGSCPPGPAEYVRDRLLPAVSARLRARTGFRTWFYGNFRTQEDPTSGWESYPPLSRYGSHFRGLLGTMDVLLEAYSYVDFRTRCDVMYGILVDLLDEVGDRGAEVVSIVEGAAERSRRETGARVGIDYGEPVREGGRLSFRHVGRAAYEHVVEAWDLDSQVARRIPGRERRDWRTTYYGRYEPTVVVTAPAAYLVPAARASAIERLLSHRLDVLRVGRAQRVRGTTYRIATRETTASPDVGDAPRTETVFGVEPSEAEVEAREGDAVVPVAQPWGRLAVYLLEPHSDDGLARWGHFDDLRVGDAFPVRRLGAVPAAVTPWA
jgi:hypothetical protein